MNEIENVFKKNKALIPYICAGDPDLNITKDLIFTLEKGGADIIELGIPFSDPLADGPVIQEAGQRALKAGTTLKKIISMVKSIRNKVNTPLVLMGYYNSISKYGKDKFIDDIVNAGISGVIIPDLPYEEDKQFYQKLKKVNISGILLAAPNTSESRLEFLGKKSSGFLYCVSLLGVTGDKKGPYQKIEEYIKKVRSRVDLPLALGFGISGSQKAKKVSKFVDGIIIGSAIIEIIKDNSDNKNKMLKEVTDFAKNIKSVI